MEVLMMGARVRSFFLVSLGFWSLVAAEDIVGRLQFPHGIPRVPLKLALNGGQHWAQTREDGGFVFHSVPAGIYSLEVLSVAHHFPQIKVDVRSRNGGRIRALQYDYPGAPKRTARYPLQIEPLQNLQYFEKRESFGIHTILRNPMMLMMGVMLFFAVVMPRMMKGMDPEEMKRMQEEMGDQDPQAMLKGFFGGPKDDDEEDE